MISDENGKKLIELAKQSILDFFEKKETLATDEQARMFSDNQGVFVTLHKNGDLRGCIGYPEPVYPLYRAIIKAARSAAFHDPRFPSLTKDELPFIKIELSVLTVPALIKGNPNEYIKKIIIGEDGLIIKGAHGSGLLLPQVFIEFDCSPTLALEMTCQKAMLPSNAWQNSNYQIYKFQAQIFNEEKK